MINDQSIKQLFQNEFYPIKDSPKVLPDCPGIYLICTNNLEKLPREMRALDYRYIEGHAVIYLGISNNLRKRDYRNHFKGNARGSTLRKSLGVLLGLKKRQSQREMGTSKFRFIQEDEITLSNWMTENLFLYFVSYAKPSELENSLIQYFNPPLNLKGNKSLANIQFRELLSKLRCKV